MATKQITWRKTKAGEWVAYGPADQIRADKTVTVTARSGSARHATIARTGRPFEVDGTEMVYGYVRTSWPAHSGRPWWDSPRERALAARDGDPSQD